MRSGRQVCRVGIRVAEWMGDREALECLAVKRSMKDSGALHSHKVQNQICSCRSDEETLTFAHIRRRKVSIEKKLAILILWFKYMCTVQSTLYKIRIMEMKIKWSYCKFGYDASADIWIFKVQKSAYTDHKPFHFWFLNSKNRQMLFQILKSRNYNLILYKFHQIEIHTFVIKFNRYSFNNCFADITFGNF